MGKSVFFAGHREAWRNLGIRTKLFSALRQLIEVGCDTFYTGSCGYFVSMCEEAVCKLKKEYPHIKLIRVDYQYNCRQKNDNFYDERYVVEFENIHYKRRITNRNKYLVDRCDFLLCNIVQTYGSGAYKTYLYAKRCGKTIINLSER